MPIEILETIAHINYNTRRPHPIDTACFFDLVKVRRLVDEATNLAVRAASDIASPTLTNVNGGLQDQSSLASPGAGGTIHGSKLSRERKFRMREQASQKLARAYRLDEIACSVATMQGASPLEDVGQLILQRNPDDPDAKYVHFFHEKIPSRQLAETTSLQPLTEIITDRPAEPEVLRTRATVRVFKEDYESAAHDLTNALSVLRYHPQPGSQTELQLQESQRYRRRGQDVILAEKDQPSSLEGQLLFHRASAYLSLACKYATTGSPPPTNEAPHGNNNTDANGQNPATPCDHVHEEARKMAKTCAKRALRDFMLFISRFEYSPDLPTQVVKEFNERVNLAAHGVRNTRASDAGTPIEPYHTYYLEELFAAQAPSELPPYPSEKAASSSPQSPPQPDPSCEWVTFHPLLIEALHCLLLCHCVIQTSVKELQRHAYMVARLVRLLDGFPAFQTSRSPARADWIEVLRRVNNWINLSDTWENLCAPAPLPLYDYGSDYPHHASYARGHGYGNGNGYGSGHAHHHHHHHHHAHPGHHHCQPPPEAPSPEVAATAAAALINGTSPAAAQEEMRREQVRQQAIMEALEDERVTDEASFRRAILARERRAEDDRLAALNAPAQNRGQQQEPAFPQPQPQQPPAGVATPPLTPQTSYYPLHETMSQQRWNPAGEDAREYPILTERASAIATWIRDVPAVVGLRRKKKPRKKGTKTEDVSEAMTALSV